MQVDSSVSGLLIAINSQILVKPLHDVKRWSFESVGESSLASSDKDVALSNSTYCWRVIVFRNGSKVLSNFVDTRESVVSTFSTTDSRANAR